MRKFVTNAFIALGAVALMASCAKSTDLFDQNAIDAQKKAEMMQEIEQTKINYEANFIKKYGAIDPNQSWDFSDYARLGTRGVTDITTPGAITTTTVAGLDFGVGEDGKVTKNNSLLHAMDEVLPESKPRTGVQAIKLLAPVSDFYIFPISTRGTWTHDLMVKVGNSTPQKLYTKTWTQYDKHYVNGMKSNGVTIDMPGLRVKAPVGTPIDIYIDNVKKAGASKPTVGTYTGQALYVDVPAGTTIDAGIPLKENAVIKYIGIEDNDGTTESSDNDYNDIVLAIVGNPDIPGETIITFNEFDVPTYFAKRYMIEDLGGADDFDFNDIVVDVHQNVTTHYKQTFVNGELKDETCETTYGDQIAEIRAMGGTLDFDLTIGNKTWSKSENNFTVTTMYNTQVGYDYDEILATFTIDDKSWNPAANNISVTMRKSGLDNLNIVYKIPFPEKGTVPMIVAVNADRDWMWMTERIHVPTWWIKNE